MNNTQQIQVVLEGITFLTLGALVIFQFLHFVIAAWRHWADSKQRLLLTSLVAIGWTLYGLFFLTVVPAYGSYIDAVPFVLAGLYTPSILALLGFAFSARFRAFADSLSLRWTIESVEGPARMTVGIIFLFWYFAGRLPGVVAWVAGPGDWIAGYISFYAVRRLQIFADSVNIKDRHWSVNQYLKQAKNVNPAVDTNLLKRNLWIAIAIVAFGIFDFFAAPASTVVSIALGTVPEEMGRLPLAFIPLLLVPQVLVLEVIAMRQFYVFYKHLRRG